MPAEPFVDRVDEFATITDLMKRACDGAGSVLVVEGQAGIGKSALMRRITGSGGPATYINVTCHAQVGQLQAYGPLLDLLLQIERNRPRRRRFFQLTGQTVKAAGPELLNLVPGLGPALKMAAETLTGSASSAPAVDTGVAARAVAEAVLQGLREIRPAVVIVDDVHRIDASSCAALSYVAQDLTRQQILIILVCRDDELSDNPAARQLVEDLCLRGEARRIKLGGLPAPAIAQLAQIVTGTLADTSSAYAMVERTGGHPLMLKYYLNDDTTRLAISNGRALPVMAGSDADARDRPAAPLPDRVHAVVQARLRRLAEDDRRLLSIAAVQGRTFQSTVVAEVAELPHDLVATRLHRLAQETGLINALDPDAWDDSVGADRYSFEHDLLQEVLYEDQSPAQRRERHRRTGQTLERYVAEHSDPPHVVALELLRHHRLSRHWLAAAHAAYRVARVLAATGASAHELAAISEQALDDVRRVPRRPEVDALRAQLINLLFAAGQLRWSTLPEADGTIKLETLAEEALDAANRSGDPDLQVRVHYLRGNVLLHTRGLTAGLDALREGWESAHRTGNPATILLAGCEYGGQFTKVDLDAGLRVLQTAYDVAVSDDEVRASDDPVVRRARHQVALQLGVNLFDAGRYGPALERLRQTVPVVRGQAALGLLPMGLNYLAQVETAAGNTGAAVRLLEEAVGLADGSEPEAWHAVNLAYLGARLALDRGDPAGLELLDRARVEAELTRLVDLTPLVGTLHGTSLLALAREDPARYDRAERVLQECLAETRRTEMRRSEVTVLSLLGRLRLAIGAAAGAAEYSDLAVRYLRAADWRLPAVCAEEILYHHSLIRRACGDPTGADEAMALARDEILRKADSLDGADRERFLTAVELNRAVLRDTA